MPQNVNVPKFDRFDWYLGENKWVSRGWARVQRASDKYSRGTLNSIDHIGQLRSPQESGRDVV